MERIYFICILLAVTIVCKARVCPDLKQSGNCVHDLYSYLLELAPYFIPNAVKIADSCKYMECVSEKVRNCKNLNGQLELYESYLKAGEYLCGEANEVLEDNAQCLSSSEMLIAFEECRNQLPDPRMDKHMYDACSQNVHTAKCMAKVGTKQCGINAGNMINKTVEIVLYPTLDYLQCVYMGADGQCHYPMESNECSLDVIMAMWSKGFQNIPNPPLLIRNCHYLQCFENAVENCPNLQSRKTVLADLKAGNILCDTAYDVMQTDPECLSTGMEKAINDCDEKETKQQDTSCGYVQASSDCTINASKKYCSNEASAKIIEAVNVVRNTAIDEMKCF